MIAKILIGIVATFLAVLGITSALRSPVLPQSLAPRSPAPPPTKISQKQNHSDASVGVLILVILAAAIGGFVWWVAPDKYVYAVQYSIDDDKVFVDKQPKDCEWEHAPLGNKECHYKKVVSLQKDDGGNVTSVYVTWEKVAD